MKFTTNTTELQRGFSKISGVIPSKSTTPILECILFDLVNDTLTITTTDLEISITISLQVSGSEDGRIAIPAKRLIDTIRALPDSSPTFVADITTNKIKITTENGEFTLIGENAKEFPSLPQFKGSDQVTLDNSSLKRIIQRTVFAVSTDELRPAMMGVLLEQRGTELRAVSTDGHRLVRFAQNLESTTPHDRSIIVPAKALSILGKSLDGGESSISLSETHIRFAFDKTILLSRLIDESYPNYESVIPSDNEKIMTIKREEIISSIRRVGLYASATTHQIRFDLKEGSLTVTAQDIDFGGDARETIKCDYTGDDLEIGFNSNYVLDILTHLEAEQVSFKLSSPTRAGLVSPASANHGEDVIMLVMPVRLNT